MAGWRVWRELRRREHIELIWAALFGHSGQIEELGGGRRRITLDDGLDQVHRNAALAHELVHDERGVLFTEDTPSAIMVKEESYVRAETVRRLVPLDELDGIVRSTVLDGGSVCPADVVEWFAVPEPIALQALEQLERRRARSRHPSRRSTSAVHDPDAAA